MCAFNAIAPKPFFQTSKTGVEIRTPTTPAAVRPPEKRLGTGVFYLGGHRAPLDPVAACRPVAGLCLRRPGPQAKPPQPDMPMATWRRRH